MVKAPWAGVVFGAVRCGIRAPLSRRFESNLPAAPSSCGRSHPAIQRSADVEVWVQTGSKLSLPASLVRFANGFEDTRRMFVELWFRRVLA